MEVAHGICTHIIVQNAFINPTLGKSEKWMDKGINTTTMNRKNKKNYIEEKD